MPTRKIMRLCRSALYVAVGLGLLKVRGGPYSEASFADPTSTLDVAFPDLGQEKARAIQTVGPQKVENSCASCHELEAEAWRHSRHYIGFSDRHRSDRAKEVLRNLGQRSMKRGTATNNCRQCHYTSVLQRDRLSPTWGVSCESCHEPAAEWIDVHNKAEGAENGTTIEWGEGRAETVEQRTARMKAAEAKGMVHAGMLYDIATNCLECHAVPNESIVNDGGHRAGSDFDLVAWTQGEVRHNFLSSAGAPANPWNRAAPPERRRMMYIVGALADLEYSLRNLSNVEQKGGAFHLAMVERVNRLREKVQRVLDVIDVPQLAAVLQLVPDPVTASTALDRTVPGKLGNATRLFVDQYKAADLSAIDDQIPAIVKGKVTKSR